MRKGERARGGKGATLPLSLSPSPPLSRIDGGVLRVALDELAARLDGVAHERRERLVGGGGVLDGDELEHPRGGVHRGGPELHGVHLAEATVALDADALPAELLDGLGELGVVQGVDLLVPLLGPVGRREGDADVWWLEAAE